MLRLDCLQSPQNYECAPLNSAVPLIANLRGDVHLIRLWVYGSHGWYKNEIAREIESRKTVLVVPWYAKWKL